MKKTIEVQTGQVYKVKIYNRCYYMGCYDGMDDWFLEGEGSTPKEAVLNALENSTDRELLEIEVDGVSWDLVDFILFEKKRYEFTAEKNEGLNLIAKQTVSGLIKNSDAFLKAKERKAIIKKLEEEIEAEKKEAEEKAEWERLNEKFKNDK
ncbi:MAG TPA: hypothetical protein DDW88_04400 [Treponema sp.]|nr:hypothetical protein [Treponema sp.]